MVPYVVAENSSREVAGAAADASQKIQANSEERDMAIRLLKTGGLEAASIKIQSVVISFKVSYRVFSF